MVKTAWIIETFRTLLKEGMQMWQYISEEHPEDNAIGIEWFNPLTDSFVVGTLSLSTMMWEVRDHDGDGDNVLTASYEYDGICKDWWPSDYLEGYRECTQEDYERIWRNCMHSLIDGFFYYQEEQKKTYEAGMAAQLQS